MTNMELRAYLRDQKLHYLLETLPLATFQEGICGPSVLVLHDRAFTYWPYPAWVILWRVRTALHIYTRAFMLWWYGVLALVLCDGALKARLQQRRAAVVWVDKASWRQLTLPLAG